MQPQWISLALCLGLLAGCNRAPKHDFTQLKRDLVALDQSLRAGLHREAGLVRPEQFVTALEQLERDYRSLNPKPSGYGRTNIESILEVGDTLRQVCNKYQLARVRGDPKAELGWSLIQNSYTLLGYPNNGLPNQVIDLLDSEEEGHPVP